MNLITWLGFFFAAAAAYLAYVAFVAFYGHTVPGWSSVIGVMLVVSAFQFMAMSILAQYLGMVFEESKRRPLYVLKQARVAQRLPIAAGGHGPLHLQGRADTDSARGLALPFASSDPIEKPTGTEVR